MEDKYIKIRLYKHRVNGEYIAVGVFKEKQNVEIGILDFEEKMVDMVDCYYFEDEKLFKLKSKKTEDADDFVTKNMMHLIYVKDFTLDDLKDGNKRFISYLLKAKEDENIYLKLKEKYKTLIREQVKKKEFFFLDKLEVQYCYEKANNAFYNAVINYRPNENSDIG